VTTLSSGLGHGAGLVVDEKGVAFLADTGGAVWRAAPPDYALSLIAGQPLMAGFADGVGASARFGGPYDVALDGNRLYVADNRNQALRIIELDTFTVTTAIGVPNERGVRLGAAAQARLNFPIGLQLLPDHSLIISDGIENALLRLGP
jgi:hypothetical protein